MATRLTRTTLGVTIAVMVVMAAALALIVLAMAGAGPSAAPTPTALPGPTEPPTLTQPGAALPTGRPAPARIVPSATASPTPTQTPTFTPPTDAPATPTREVAPAAAPEVTVVAETQTGPGVSRSFDLPEGLYRVTFHADDGFDLVLPIVEDGDCGSEPLFDGGTGVYDGTATYDSTGCRVHFEVDGAGGGWSLGVSTISDAAPKSLPLTLTGRAPKTSDVLDLPPGTYLVAAESQGDSLVVTPLVLDGECLERPILVATAPGSYQTTYDSAGCKIIFQVSLTDGPWTLTVSAQP